MSKRRIGRTDLYTKPIVIGGNVFGWTADEAASMDILDRFLAAGYNAVDTADTYSRWVPGNDSESERIIGRWMRARGNRDKVLVFTKVGSPVGEGTGGLGTSWIQRAVEASLTRLQTDYIDLYQSHVPDPATPIEETLGAYQRLIEAGKVRHIGASAHNQQQLTEALDAAKGGLPRYQAIQNEFNLCSTDQFDDSFQKYCVAEAVSGIHYKGLASGFLTGKYRSLADATKSKRGARIAKDYCNERGWKVLAELDAVAGRTGAPLASIALAWVLAQPGVAAALVSATSSEQLTALMAGDGLKLTADDIALLSASTAP